MSSIDSNTTINHLLIDHPAVITILNEYGVDACCGGASTLAEVAAADGIDLEALLAALEQMLDADNSPTITESAP